VDKVVLQPSPDKQDHLAIQMFMTRGHSGPKFHQFVQQMRVRLGVHVVALIAASAHPCFFGTEIQRGQVNQLVKQPVFGLAQCVVERRREKLVDDLDHTAMLTVDDSNTEF